VICLQFESFTDGRPYSQACLLRDRYGYSGELRVRGNVLRDQFGFMRGCGIDALEVAVRQQAILSKEPTRSGAHRAPLISN
jgi:uncharacterized protein (DUF934 family)